MPAGGSALLTDADTGLYLHDDKNEEMLRAKAPLRFQIQLTGDTWARDVAAAGASSAELIASFSSIQTSPRGWNAVVRQMLSAADLERVDDTTLVLSVPQTAEYDISEPETIVAEILGGALLSGVDAPLTPAGPAGMLVIRALPGTAALGGSLLGAADVFSIQSPEPSTLQVQLNNVEFSDQLAASMELQTALVRSGTSAQSSEYGWNAIVQPALSAANLQIVDQTSAIITIPQFGRYSITSPETITLTVPAVTLKCCGEDVLATPAFIVQAPQPEARFGGTLLKNVGENELRTTANYTLSVTLTGDEWSAAMDMDEDVRPLRGSTTPSAQPPPPSPNI